MRKTAHTQPSRRFSDDFARPHSRIERALATIVIATLLGGFLPALAHAQEKSQPRNRKLAIPPGFEVQVRPRSGLAAKHGVTCLNTPGTIDWDYRGEVKVILINHGTEPFVIRRGERVAQMVVAPVTQAQFEPVDTLPDTARGAGGFGSTGK